MASEASARTVSLILLSIATAASTLQSAGYLRGVHTTEQEADGSFWPIFSSHQKTYWMKLENLGDVQYTGLMRVGDQQMKAIIDTGSFELLVFGVNCTLCGQNEHLYNGSKSRDYVVSSFPGTHTFGSGTTYSLEARDKVQIGALHIPTQVFWEVNDADMPLLSEDSFQIIVGVGPPKSVEKFAEDQAAEVHKELKEYTAKNKPITNKVKAIVDHYDAEVIHAKNTTTVAENLDLDNMAICLGKSSGSHGYFIWNDQRSVQSPEKFTEVAVAGDIYWSANMSRVRLSDAPGVDSNATEAMKEAAKAKKLGCVKENCSAVIDTGTSLIVAPTEIAEQVFEAMQQWIEAGGTCDDLSKLPDLEFKLNGVPFSLPPEAYIGKMSGQLGDDMKEFMPHLYSERHHKLYEALGCQPLIMTMDADSQFGPLWILGMPFFRKYYTNFKFNKYIGKLSMPQATSMSFSEADAQCRPSRAPAATGVANLMTKASNYRPAQLKVEASKLRVSNLALKIRRDTRGNMLTRPTVRI